MEPPLWTPSPSQAHATQMAAFADAAGCPLDELHQWSVNHQEDFWDLVWSHFGIVGHRGDGPAMIQVESDLAATTFFPDATLNYAENLLQRNDHHPALIFCGEDNATRTLTWAQLHHLVSQLQQGLAAAGVKPGDRVAAWLPNIPEAYAVMLACASLGAVFSSVSPDFGTDAVIDRFGQIEPKVIFCTNGYQYGGKRFDVTDKVSQVIAALPSLRQVVMVADTQGDLPAEALSFDDFCAAHPAQEVAFTPLPFDHPLYILYSSGTTGAPKCIIHRAGGLLLKHLVEHRLHCDVRPLDRVFYFTTTGWMMWNWLAAGLAAHATLILYDGSPFYPDGQRLFDLVDAHQITLLGVSAKFIDSVNSAELRPITTHRLESLRTVCSTGSPLSAEGFRHVYTDWKPDLHVASISGGTDLCGCLVGGNPAAPVFAGQIQGAVLGQDMAVVDQEGHSVAPGQQGELVCRSPFPTMPLGFWDDPENLRYHETYFARFPGYWHQGDFAEQTPQGGFIIHGRSDATLNPGGVRMGTAEIYRIVEAFTEVTESLVIGQQWEGDVRVVLFVVTANQATLDDDLIQRLRTAVRTGASPRHVPAVVIAVPDLPHTRSGKLVELAVRNVVENRPVTNAQALANPEALAHFQNLPALQPHPPRV
ncbi:MAG TPA: acetoacetate--CoA ligase [Acidimicrobiia bacterium]|nr:acetoacetate--CoA ligase [Acidimicrobiia bacterium]HIL46166.1 acetoacetate--CoA ligase [Acidimicrobiia bacterium]